MPRVRLGDAAELVLLRRRKRGSSEHYIELRGLRMSYVFQLEPNREKYFKHLSIVRSVLCVV